MALLPAAPALTILKRRWSLHLFHRSLALSQHLSSTLYKFHIDRQHTWVIMCRTDNAASFVIENQAGQSLQLTEGDRKAVGMGLAMHSRGQISLKQVHIHIVVSITLYSNLGQLRVKSTPGMR